MPAFPGAVQHCAEVRAWAIRSFGCTTVDAAGSAWVCVPSATVARCTALASAPGSVGVSRFDALVPDTRGAAVVRIGTPPASGVGADSIDPTLVSK